MALTLVSLGFLIAVGLGGTNKSNNGLNKLYFFRANTSDINPGATNVDIPGVISQFLNVNASSTGSNTTAIQDFYHVGLWNYCSGDFGNNNSVSKDNANDHVTYCSKRTNEFWFNPVEVWGLNQTQADALFGKELTNGLKVYRTVAKWMFISYLVATIATAVEVIVGFFALFSRWGSLVTTIVSSVSGIFLIGFALTSTILFSTLTGTFNHALKKYNIHASLGHNVFVLIWLSVAFSWAAGIFWLFSSCCCSGRSDRIKGYNDKPSQSSRGASGGGGGGRGFKAEHTPYTYERVESPFLGHSANAGTGPSPSYHQNVPMANMGPKDTAYEPFRHGET